MNAIIIIIGVLFLLVAFWIFKCIVIVRENEIGVEVTLGKPNPKAKESGLYFVPWPFVVMLRYTTKRMSFRFKVSSIVSKKGWAKGHDGLIEPADIDIIGTFYCQFSKENIINAVQRLPGNNAKQNGPFLVPIVTGALRALAGQIPWRLTNQERFRFSQWIKARMEGGIYAGISGNGTKDDQYIFNTEPKNYLILTQFNSTGKCELDVKDHNGVSLKGKSRKEIADSLGIDEEKVQIATKPLEFINAGLENFSLEIEDVNFTNEELGKAISAPEKTRLEAEAKSLAAEGEKTKKIKEGEGDAAAREAMLNVIAKHPEFEALKTLADMAKGESNTIFYQQPNDLILAPITKLLENKGARKQEDNSNGQ